MKPRQIPWDDIREAQIEKAKQELRRNPIVPSPAHGGWLITSSVQPEMMYLVKPKWDKTQRAKGEGRKNGHFWQLLTCNCKASTSGYFLCWHKAAVFVYWQHCRDAKRPMGVGPWQLDDGPQDDPATPAILVASTPAEGKVVGPPTPPSKKRGTKRPAGKPSASGVRKTRPRSR